MTRSILVAVVALLAAPAASADEPGPGGSRPVVSVTGEQVYKNVCQACHMADGKGGVGAAAIPALANNRRLAAAAYPIILVGRGRGAMPWFNDALSPAQIANVVGYIRTHFGNDFPQPVTEAEVAKLIGTPPASEH